MKLVILESPYKGQVARNKRYLRACIRDCINRGESPYASHRMLTDALDDNNPLEREVGIRAGLAWRYVRTPILSSDGVVVGHMPVSHVFYVDLEWSEGMLRAKKVYDDEKIPYEERKLLADDPFWETEIIYVGGRPLYPGD
jgi:hypothetical protein